MRRLIFILTIILTVLNHCHSQGQSKSDSIGIRRSSVFLEIGGNATVYSINYDYLVIAKKHFKTALTIGLSGYKGSPYPDIELSPQLNLLFGGKVCAEIGVGYTKSLTFQNGYAVLRLGFRNQRPDGGIFWRFAFTPLLQPFGEALPFWPWLGLSIGYTIQ
jgi:hypothetical protein